MVDEAAMIRHMLEVKIFALVIAFGFELVGMGSLLRYAAQADQSDTYYKQLGGFCVWGGLGFLVLALH